MNTIYTFINSRLSNAKTLSRYFPIVLQHGDGIHVKDMNNYSYIDCISAASALPLGHNHPYINKTIKEFIDNKNPIQTMDIPTTAQYRFMYKLYNFLPTSISNYGKLQMCSPSGSDAVEAAIKLAKINTGCESILSFKNSYHGQSYASLSISGRLENQFVFSKMPQSYILPYPKKEDEIEESIQSIMKYISSNIQKPAAIIYESIQGEGGLNKAPKQWIERLREITYDYNIILIADEIQTGFCRTGYKFGFEESGINPDIICMAKALGGSMPLAAILYNQKFDKWKEYQHAGTWRGNQLAFATGEKIIEIMHTEKLWENAKYMESIFYEFMKDLKYKYPFIGEIKGKGLMLGFEINDKLLSKEEYNCNEINNYNKTLAKHFQKICMDNGLLLLRAGEHGNIIRILPPLNITTDEMEEILFILYKSCNILK